jgi:hypothetical protein
VKSLVFRDETTVGLNRFAVVGPRPVVESLKLFVAQGVARNEPSVGLCRFFGKRRNLSIVQKQTKGGPIWEGYAIKCYQTCR